MQWYFKVFVHYFDFKGRASRAEYWWFRVVDFFITLLFAIPYGIAAVNENEAQLLLSMGFLAVYSLITFIPRLAVTARRLHDTGRSGLNYLWNFLPIVGPFILFYFLVCRSEEDKNNWGPDPRIVDYKAQVSY